LIIAILIGQGVDPAAYTSFKGFAHLGAGLSVGLAGMGTRIIIIIIINVEKRNLSLNFNTNQESVLSLPS